LLKVENVNVFISESQVLRDINLSVQKGEVVSIVGRNGAGKTTLLKTIIGLVKPRSGKISFLGKDITGLHPFEIAKMGVGYAPDDLRIFPSLTVEENIELPILAAGKSKRDRVEFAYSIFPKLLQYRKKPGTHISGGERKMLAIARALALDPTLLLLDEPLEGLAPVLLPELNKSIYELARSGLTLLLTESNIYRVPKFTDTLCVIERGELIYSGRPDKAYEEERVRKVLGL
jgi:branched-chain amino acid transport system ATP-binding protein